MRILWVKAGGLVPPDTGGKIRSYNILRELARSHSITFFSFHAAHHPDIHSDLGSIFHEVVSVPLALAPPRGTREMLDYTSHLLSREPYNITKYCQEQVRKRLQDMLRKNEYDVIVCDFLVAAGVIPWNDATPKILFAHNVESAIWRRHFEVARNPLWKAASWLEWKKMNAAEHRYMQLADHVAAVSETDAATFARFLARSKLTVVPTGVDLEYFRPTPGEEDPNLIVFMGSMDWMPNEDGVLFFAESILPLVQQKRPDSKLLVIGRNPSQRLRDLAHQHHGVEFTGWVGDVRPHLRRASVCVVPLRIGGGTRLKIFEAMAMAKAVVSTTIGAEGLPVHPGETILLGDTAEEFAAHVLHLLQDSTRRRRVGQHALQMVSRDYGWNRVADGFSQMLHRVVQTHHIAGH